VEELKEEWKSLEYEKIIGQPAQDIKTTLFGCCYDGEKGKNNYTTTSLTHTVAEIYNLEPLDYCNCNGR